MMMDSHFEAPDSLAWMMRWCDVQSSKQRMVFRWMLEGRERAWERRRKRQATVRQAAEIRYAVRPRSQACDWSGVMTHLANHHAQHFDVSSFSSLSFHHPS